MKHQVQRGRIAFLEQPQIALAVPDRFEPIRGGAAGVVALRGCLVVPPT